MANSKNRRHRNRLVLAPESLEQRRVLATLAGTVFEDTNNDGEIDASEPTLSGVVVYIDANDNGLLDQRGFGLDPDDFAPGQVLNNSRQNIFPSATATDNQPAFRVLAVNELRRATTGQRVFGLEDTVDWGQARRLRFDFTLPVDSVSIDAVGSSGISNPNVRLDVYDINGQLLGSRTENSLANAVTKNLEVTRPQKDISYAVAYVTTVVGTVKFDNLRADDAGSERATLTADTGFYWFGNVPPGPAVVAQQPAEGYDRSIATGPYRVDVAAGGGGRTNLDFANRTGRITGLVFEDVGTIGLYEPGTDRTIEGAGVYLDSNSNGTPDPNSVSISPDAFLNNQELDFVSNEVQLSTVDQNNASVDERVVAATDVVVSPGQKLFTHEGNPAWTNAMRFRADFSSLANRVQIRFTGGTTGEVGKLVAYSSIGEEIASAETLPLDQGESAILNLERNTYDISYAVAYTSTPTAGSEGNIRLSNLLSVMVKEPIAITDFYGEYEFSPLSRGNYQVRALPTNVMNPSFPESQVQQVSVTVGETKEEIDFGFEPDNKPPIARNDFVRTQEDFGIPIVAGVLVNDSDPDGQLNEQSVTISQFPSSGTAEVDSNGFIIYTPNPDFHGRDTLLYTVEDDQGGVSNTAVLTIQVDSVNDAPVAEDDNMVVLGLSVTSFDVLSNDHDIDGQIAPTTVKIVQAPIAGSTVVNAATGVITYIPAGGAVSDTLTYTVEDNDGATSDPATVFIDRLTSGIAPVAVDDSASTLEGTATQITVAANDTDADGTVDMSSVFVVSLPNSGDVTVENTGHITYQPNLGFIGVDSFAYRVKDDEGFVSNLATVTVSMSERDFPYQNPINSLDVDGDGNVSPRDVLFIIDEIDDRDVSNDETGAITVNPTPGTRPAGYFDVDGNGFVIGRDVLAVVLHINEELEANGEPPTAQSTDAVASVFAAAFNAFADEDEEEEEESMG